MSIKTYKPTTPSRRHMTVSGFDGIDKKAKPERSLTETLKKSAGRNSYGRITVRHRGGGNKVKYRIIDFKRDKVDMEATVLRLEYDPNRSAFIALVQYEDGEKRYILPPEGLKAGDKIVSSAEAGYIHIYSWYQQAFGGVMCRRAGLMVIFLFGGGRRNESGRQAHVSSARSSHPSQTMSGRAILARSRSVTQQKPSPTE